VVAQIQHRSSAAAAALDQFQQTRATEGDDGNFGAGEDAVSDDQQKNDQELGWNTLPPALGPDDGMLPK
jgi:hypothetical protein